MFNVIIKDVETGCAVGAIKDTFTIPCEGEALEIDGKHWIVVTSFYEPSLRGLSTDTHVVWATSLENTGTQKGENHDNTESNDSTQRVQ